MSLLVLFAAREQYHIEADFARWFEIGVGPLPGSAGEMEDEVRVFVVYVGNGVRGGSGDEFYVVFIRLFFLRRRLWAVFRTSRSSNLTFDQ
jgi:hypothetical protein